MICRGGSSKPPRRAEVIAGLYKPHMESLAHKLNLINSHLIIISIPYHCHLLKGIHQHIQKIQIHV